MINKFYNFRCSSALEKIIHQSSRNFCYLDKEILLTFFFCFFIRHV
uniref:Uncharacterized protein n=1 Tax=Anguilla anguilla TaxID=7936 RepID=A0A0E9XW66_ANGAN